MGWFWTMCAGFTLELVGFAFAAFGLWQTWWANADGRPFFHPRIRNAARWTRVNVFRQKPKPVTVNLSAGMIAGLTMDASAFVSMGLTDDMTVEAKIATVQDNALKALADASSAHGAVRQEQRAREKAVKELESRIAAAEQQLTVFAKGLVVDGIPLTVAGLVFAVIGLLLQAVASVATFT